MPPSSVPLSSVKPNIGHLLTAAGAAGVLRVLLAMANRKIPPIANTSRPMDALSSSPFYLPQAAESWDRRKEEPRRAAISGFGFGGINAHLIMEEPGGSSPSFPREVVCDENTPIAIVGIGSEDVRESLEIPLYRFKIPPVEQKQLLPQQLLLLSAAKRAIDEHGIVLPNNRESVGVFVGLGLDGGSGRFRARWRAYGDLVSENEFDEESAQGIKDAIAPALNAERAKGVLGGLIASRVAREYRFGGPAFAFSSQENSGLCALDRAIRMLKRKEIEMAVVAAVDAAGTLENEFAASLDNNEGEGKNLAIAWVLKNLDRAKSDGDKVLAVVGDVSLARTDSSQWRLDIQSSSSAANDIKPSGRPGVVASLEVATIGARALASRQVGGGYWLHNRADGPRQFHARCVGSDGSVSEIRLSEPDGPQKLHQASLAQDSARSFSKVVLIGGDSLDEVRSALGQLSRVDHLPERIVRLGSERSTPLRLGVLWDPTKKSLEDYMHRSLALLEGVGDGAMGVDPSGIWASRNFRKGRLAFVFPGIGSQFAGMGRELSRAFPNAMLKMESEFDRLRTDWCPENIWVGDHEVDPLAMNSEAGMASQAMLGTFVYQTLEDLGVRPDAVIGYSLGESVGLFAAGVWHPRPDVLARLRETSLFSDWLSGPLKAVRQHWRIPDQDPVQWKVCVVRSERDEVRASLDGLDRCYLMNINSPRECVVGGDRDQIETLVERLGVNAAELPGAGAIHAPPVAEVLSDFKEFHRFPVRDVGPIDFYSGSSGGKIELTTEGIVESIGAHALEGVDFVSTISKAHEDGVTDYVEIGPGSSCSRMIRETLLGQTQRVHAICPNQSELKALLSSLGQLFACGYDVTASKLDERMEMSKSQPKVKIPMNLDLPKLPSNDVIKDRRPWLDYAGCLEFARGDIGKVLGPDFAPIDSHPTRVRLPDEPLMLCHRIMKIEGEPKSLGSGRIVTEHDVKPEVWYLDNGQVPPSIVLESGQADLFLAAYLGVDFETRGKAVYRLLDAQATFRGSLPKVGDTIRYDIRIHKFFRQGDIILFKFAYEATCAGEPVLTIADACAGFFTDEQLKAGKGIIDPSRRIEVKGKTTGGFEAMVPLTTSESYSETQLEALKRGNPEACFGPRFSGLNLKKASCLPSGRMNFVHRIQTIEGSGGKFGLGRIVGEADIHPDDWFLTCHFIDDIVMPGNLMLECCLHTLRILMMRLGWVSEEESGACGPIPDRRIGMRCRGQVLQSTSKVTYEIHPKEIGYDPSAYVVCDARMYADGKPIADLTDLSLRYGELTKAKVESVWNRARVEGRQFSKEQVLAFAGGKPSDAFGDKYRDFDELRVIARLPRAPFLFLDHVDQVQGEPWIMKPGGSLVGHYDVPVDEWYFKADQSGFMPFAVLLEIALQPCGWLAAYMGSALTSDKDLSFRNLGGNATQFLPVGPEVGRLSTEVKSTNVSKSGGMIIQNYDFLVSSSQGTVYSGSTVFGFFSKSALSSQVGVRGANTHRPSVTAITDKHMPFPDRANLPVAPIVMMDVVTELDIRGGEKQLGYIQGAKEIKPDEWFFEAHFYQDPVWPGSLGLEAFLQLLRVLIPEKFPGASGVECVALGTPHQWTYRGQVLPSDKLVTVEAEVTDWNPQSAELSASGYLTVDGRIIYQIDQFKVKVI